MAKDKILSLADELEEVMHNIDVMEESILPFKKREEEIREELVKSLLKKGLEYVRTSSGLSFGLVSGRVTFKVKKGKEQQALKWALEEYPSIVSLTAAKLNKVAQPMLDLPDFLERTAGEPHLAVRTNNEET